MCAMCEAPIGSGFITQNYLVEYIEGIRQNFELFKAIIPSLTSREVSGIAQAIAQNVLNIEILSTEYLETFVPAATAEKYHDV